MTIMDKKILEPDENRNKRLLWVVNERKEHYSLSVERSISSFLLPTETVVATSARTDFSNKIMSAVQKTVDGKSLEKMESADKYRFLPAVCDFVIFQDSPLMRAKYSK